MKQQALPLPELADAVPNSLDRIRLSAESLVNPKTVLRCYKSLPVRSSVAVRIVRAARKLGLPEPRFVVA